MKSRIPIQTRLLFILLMISGILCADGAAQSVTIGTLFEDLRDNALPPGRKDPQGMAGPMRYVGISMWYTGDNAGGYPNVVSQLVNDQDVYDDLMTALGWTGVTLTKNEIVTHLYPRYYTNYYVKFSMDDKGNDDFSTMFDGTLYNFITTQNTIFSPTRDENNNVDFYKFDQELNPNLWDRAKDPMLNLKFVQNIGHGANELITSGEFNLNLEYPLIVHKHLAWPAALNRAYVNFLYIAQGVICPWMFGLLYLEDLFFPYPVPSIFHTDPLKEDYIELLDQSIVERVNAYDNPNAPDLLFNIIGGEFDVWIPSPNGSVFDPVLWKERLPLTDYSPESILHFQEWLRVKYGDNIQNLNKAWGQGISAFDDIDPQDHSFTEVAFYDWLEFQKHQEWCVLYHQYRVAKFAQPQQVMNLLTFECDGVERCALKSDAVVSANWYYHNEMDNYGPLDIPSYLGLITRYGSTYGESVNYPLTGLPRRLKDNGKIMVGWDPEMHGIPLDIPPTYKPPKYDVDFSWRTFRELMGLGVEVLGLGYPEVATMWSNIRGMGRAMMEGMAEEADDYRDELTIMTPYRSPLLVQTHQDRSAMARWVLEWLIRKQVQYAPFSDLEGFEDLWVPSARQVMLPVYIKGLDTAMLIDYWTYGLEKDIHILIITNEQIYDQLPGGFPEYEYVPDLFYRVYREDPALIVIAPKKPTSEENKELLKEILNAPFLDLWLDPGDTVQPVTATSKYEPTFDGFDVSLSTDGLNFFVSVANCDDRLNPVTHTLDLAVTSTVIDRFNKFNDWLEDKYIVEGGNLFTLEPGKTAVRYLSADIPDFDPNDLTAWINFAKQKVSDLSNDYNVEAADDLIAEIDYLMTVNRPVRALAGLLRLHRMVFGQDLHPVPGLMTLKVVDLFGNPVAGAPVQTEFVLHDRFRRDENSTDANGEVDIILDAPSDAKVWDFYDCEYKNPDDIDLLVEVHFQHPTYKTQNKIVWKDF